MVFCLQAVVNALPVKPMLLREPCPDLLLDRFTPDASTLDARVDSSDLARESVVGQQGALLRCGCEQCACMP